MSIKIKIIFLFFFITFSCNEELANVLSFEDFSEEFQGNCKGDNCAKVTIDYCKIIGKKEVTDKINFTVGNAIIYSLKSNFDENVKANTITEAANDFLKSYESDKKEFPELSPYIAELSISTSYLSPLILCLKTDFYSFTDGVHGNGRTNFLNFDSLTGNLKSTSSILNNKKEFIDIIEKAFRNEKGIPLNDPINSTDIGLKMKNFIYQNQLECPKLKL
ncbi:MAG: hypothetical protein ACI93P_000345 [bacterium]|jgi:hypothetical protein